jgi:hypothetical protein
MKKRGPFAFISLVDQNRCALSSSLRRLRRVRRVLVPPMFAVMMGRVISVVMVGVGDASRGR